MLVAVIASQVAILVMLIARRRPASIKADGDELVEPAGATSLVPASLDLVEAENPGDAGNQAAIASLLNNEELAIQVDRSEPFMHLRFAADLPPGALPPDDPNLSRLMGSLGDVLPLIPKGLPDGYMVARFAPEVATMLKSGQARLMVSQGQEVMKAVSTSNGQVIATARRVSESGAAIGAVALGPVGIAVAVAVVAASWHHQRWVDRTLGRIARSTAALETRSVGTTTTGPSSRERTRPSATSTSSGSGDPHHP